MTLELPDSLSPAPLFLACWLAANSRAVSAQKIWPTAKSPPSKESTRSECAPLTKVLFSFAARSRVGLSASNAGPACLMLTSAGLYLRRFRFLGHRVVTKLARQRLAPQQAHQPHPRPPHHAKPLDRLIHVHGAGRLEPATPREQNREVHLINTQNRQRRFHSDGLLACCAPSCRVCGACLP